MTFPIACYFRLNYIGYSIVFKKASVEVYYVSFFSTFDVLKYSTICLVFPNSFSTWSSEFLTLPDLISIAIVCVLPHLSLSL